MGRGFVPPGYKYLGPGNDLNRGKPTNAADALAKQHDILYDALLKAGANPYTQWSDADQEFFSHLKVNDIPTAIAKGLFGFKKGLHKVGLISKASLSKMPSKRKANQQGGRDEATNPALRGAIRQILTTLDGNIRDADGHEDRGPFGSEGFINSEDTPTNNEPFQPVIDRSPPNDGGPMSLSDLLPSAEDAEEFERDMSNIDVPMDGGDEQPETMALRAGGTPGNPVSKETPISRYPSLTYGLQETHTTILPWCGYIATTGMTHGVPNVLELRMTQPFDMIATTLQGLAAGAAWGKDFYVVPYNNSNTRDAATAPTFPSTLDSGPATTEKASWWEYWRKFYEYYTVLGCEYEIFIDNPNETRGTDVVVGWDFNAYSDTATASGNKTPQNQTLAVMKQYKGIQWRTVEQCSNQINQKRQIMIKGTYKPGQTRRNIVNDGDVKTWAKTNNGGTPDSPTLKEFLTLYFYRHELAWLKDTTKTLGVNMQIILKSIL